MKFLLLHLFLLVGIVACGQKIGKKDFPLIAIQEVNTTPYDTFRLEAIVKDIYICPPCPKGAICKPCIGDHLMVTGFSESIKNIVTVFAEKPGEFIRERAYLFTLKLSNKSHLDEGAMLITSEPSKR